MKSCLTLTSILSATLLLTAQSEAQTPRTIRVTGSATATASPNYVVIRGTLTDTGESAKEAMASFAKAKEALAKVLDGGPGSDQTVQFAGEKLASGDGAGGVEAVVAAAAFGGDAPVEAKQFTVSEEVVIRLPIENDMQRSGIVKQLSTTVDGAGKAGLSFGSSATNIYAAMGMGMSPSVVQFGLDEKGQAELQAKAATAAYENATARAAALAKLAGGRIGKVISVEEAGTTDQSGGLEAIQMNMLARMMGGQSGAKDGTIDHNGRIEMQQQIVVTFELVE